MVLNFKMKSIYFLLFFFFFSLLSGGGVSVMILGDTSCDQD